MLVRCGICKALTPELESAAAALSKKHKAAVQVSAAVSCHSADNPSCLGWPPVETGKGEVVAPLDGPGVSGLTCRRSGRAQTGQTGSPRCE